MTLFQDPVLAEIVPAVELVMEDRGGFGKVSRLGEVKDVADDTSKWLVCDRKGLPAAVILCSSPVEPTLVKQSTDKASAVRRELGLELGSVVLEPLLSGEAGGLSYVVWPYCRPLSSSRWRRRVQSWALRPQVLAWLREVSRVTAKQPDAIEVRDRFVHPLERIQADTSLSKSMRLGANKALKRLEEGAWRPRFVLTHNDFWDENILLQPDREGCAFGFVVIDWAGAVVQGHVMYDLMRIAPWLRLSGRKLAREVEAHCRILENSVSDAEGYLLASLGWLGMHLGYFPRDRYVALAEECHQRLLAGLQGV